MPRFHVHCVPSGADAAEFAEADVVFTVTVTAPTDRAAQEIAWQMLAVRVDVQEIELADEVEA